MLKLYFIRNKVTKAIRRKMRNFKDFFVSSNDLEIPAEEMLDEDPAEETPVVDVTETTQEQVSETESKE